MRQLGISKSFYRTSISVCNMFVPIAIAAAGMFSSTANAQCELQTIWSPDPGQDHLFGLAVAGSSDLDVLVIGEFGNNDWTGKAYIYGNTGGQWQLEEVLVAPDGPMPFTQFAWHVDMSADGKTILISEIFDSNNGLIDNGAAWILVEEADKWVVQQKLTASEAENGWALGEELALSDDGNVAAISATGAPGDPVYVFVRNGETWTEATKLEGNGISLGLPWIDASADGSVIAIGAAFDSEMGASTGAVYIFVRDGAKGSWLLRQKIHTEELELEANFGRSVSLSATGDTLIAGAFNASGKNTFDSGAVFVFERKGDLWFEQAKLIASDAQTQDHFGATTKLTPDGQRTIIKAGNGSAYVFDIIDSKWIETMRLIASGPNVLGIGRAIDITDDGSTALLGAPNSRVDGVFWYGAAVLFDLEAPLGDFNCDGVISTIDLLTLFSNWGTCFDCEFFNGCPADLNLDCTVNISDLLILLSNWG